MYKVFFNGRTIVLDDKIPDNEKITHDFIITFGSINDLKSRLTDWLKSGREDNLHIWHSDSEQLIDAFSSCFTLIPASGGLVKNNKAEDLVIFRRGVWDLPKGKAESGESPEQTALREVGEECHLKKLKIKRFLITTYHIYFLNNAPVLKETKWFEMKYEGRKDPRPQKKEEITKTIWLPYSQLNTISGNTFPTVLEVIRAGQLQGVLSVNP
jgi:ADP-ribose pyrophosphatase YjhB (NUDIX family)